MGRRTVGEKSLGLLLINPRIMIFFLLHIAFVVKSVGKHIWTLKESSSVYILNIGGFGHTITQAETYFAYIDPEGKVIALLTPGAHNLNILSLYPVVISDGIGNILTLLLWISNEKAAFLIESLNSIA